MNSWKESGTHETSISCPRTGAWSNRAAGRTHLVLFLAVAKSSINRRPTHKGDAKTAFFTSHTNDSISGESGASSFFEIFVAWLTKPNRSRMWFAALFEPLPRYSRRSPEMRMCEIHRCCSSTSLCKSGHNTNPLVAAKPRFRVWHTSATTWGALGQAALSPPQHPPRIDICEQNTRICAHTGPWAGACC
jgi:hypothetical protein